MIKKKESSFDKNIFAFVISYHEILGTLIEPYAVQENDKGFFSYDFKKINKKTYNDFFNENELSDAEKAGIDIIDEYSEENLLKRFNRNKAKAKDFTVSLEKDYVDNHIRPFIDKRLYKLAGILAKNKIPLYYKGDINDRIIEDEIFITPEETEVLFCFDKQENQTLYSLKINHNNKKIDLQTEGAEMLAVNPCLLFVNNVVYRFNSDWDGKKLLPFFNKESLIIPKSSEKIYYQKFVLNAVKNYNVQAVGFDINYFDKEVKPIIKLENALNGECVVGLYFNYDDYITYAYKEKANNHTIISDKANNFNFLKIKRDVDAEENAANILSSFGLVHKEAMQFSLNDEKRDCDGNIDSHDLIDWLIGVKDKLLEKGFNISQNISVKKYLTTKPLLEIDSHGKQDWFDLKIVVMFGKHSVPFVKLKNNILKENREYVLPDGEIALLPKEWFARFKDIFHYGVFKGEEISLNRHHYTLLTNFDNGKKFAISKSEIEPVRNIDPPAELKAVLRNYQVDGYRWLFFLMKNKFGGVLADDMGLGKTLQVICLLSKIYLDSEIAADYEVSTDSDQADDTGLQLDIFDPDSKTSSVNKLPTLIVMPLSLIHNWAREIKRFAPYLKVYQHVGSNRATSVKAFKPYNIILTTYGTVRNDIDFLKEYRFHHVILDESQIIKNAGSKIFRAVKTLQSNHRLVMTGTPIENSLTDLWSQFSFLNPGMLGSLSFFKEEYVVPVERDRDVLKREKLQKLIHPFVLRRTKDEVEKELPELTEMVHYCEMTEEQEKIYEEKKSEIRNYIIDNVAKAGIDKSRFLILSGLMRLRLLANHPVMTDPEYVWSSGKYIEITRSIEKLITEKHKVLVFSQFVKHLNIFKNYLEEKDISYSFLSGNTSGNERLQLIDKFQNNPDNRLFLISLKAGGVGLNLTGADYVFLLDPWWNPAVENQAINRAHRIGQDKKVFVYKFITRNTIEEKIAKLQQKKSELAGMVINSNNPLNNMDVDQLQSLL